MQIPSESFEAVGYCLLSVKSIDNKYLICETDVSGMSDTMSDTISDSSSNVLSISDSSSNMLSISDNNPLEFSVSDIDISDIDISDIDFSDIEKFYFEDKHLPDIKIHEEKKIYIDEQIDFHEFYYILSTIIESFVFEEVSYLFYIFV